MDSRYKSTGTQFPDMNSATLIKTHVFSQKTNPPHTIKTLVYLDELGTEVWVVVAEVPGPKIYFLTFIHLLD
jgi:hypothetical protein